jgi:hypothetical protein
MQIVVCPRAVDFPATCSFTFTEVLKSLSPVSSARHDSRTAPSGCLNGTREDVLRVLNTWVHQRTSELSIFWLAGMAGTGKTTITKTFCDRTAQDETLGASFFISRHDEARREPSNIVRTLAYALAYSLPRARQPILDALRSFPDVMNASVEQLIPRLIAAPLSSSRDTGNADSVVVLVIEALDECLMVGNLEGGQLVPLLVSALKTQPVKLLITSRMESSILDMFALLAPVSVRLHDIDKDKVASDIRRYFEDSFATIRRSHRITDTDWPSAFAVEDLTEKAGHLFIYASTVVRYVGHHQHNPRTRLGQVLHPGISSSVSPYRLVDDLYLQVLRSAVETTEDDEELLCRRLRLILGAVIFLQTPFAPPVLATLLTIDLHELTIVLRYLSAVLLPAMDQPIRLFHPSFQDFIVNTARCRDTRFRLDPGVHHQLLAARCLAIMNNQLCQDICGIRDPTQFNAAVSDLSQRLGKSVSPELRYAAVFWMTHTTFSVTAATSVFEELATFCGEHILHWLELLSLLGQLSVASKGFPALLEWTKVNVPCRSTSECS